MKKHFLVAASFLLLFFAVGATQPVFSLQQRQRVTVTEKRVPAQAATAPEPVSQQATAPAPAQPQSPSMYERGKGAFDRMIGFIPDFIGGLLILVIGWIIASSLRSLARNLLPRSGVDDFLRRRGLIRDQEERIPVTGPGSEVRQRADFHESYPFADRGPHYPASDFLAGAIYWLVLLMTFAQVARAWRLETVANGLARVVAYVPHVIAAALIFGVSLVIADWVRDRVVGPASGARSELVGGGVKAVILTFGGFLALRELQIAPDIVRIAFTLVLGAIAVAVALAFGLGGRSAVEQMTTEMYERGRARPERYRDAA